MIARRGNLSLGGDAGGILLCDPDFAAAGQLFGNFPVKQDEIDHESPEECRDNPEGDPKPAGPAVPRRTNHDAFDKIDDHGTAQPDAERHRTAKAEQTCPHEIARQCPKDNRQVDADRERLRAGDGGF